MARRGSYKVFSSKDIDVKVALFIKRVAELFIKKKGRFNCALAGGETPLKAYSILANLPLDWTKTSFFLTDERFVPPEDERSNCRRIRQILSDRVKCFDLSLDIYESAKLYSENFKEIKCLDLVLLGIGEDGHTASLFPNTVCQKVTPHLCISKSPDGIKRISLTEEFINLSEKIAFFAKGDRKREVIKRVLRGEDMPATRIKNCRSIIIFTD